MLDPGYALALIGERWSVEALPAAALAGVLICWLQSWLKIVCRSVAGGADSECIDVTSERHGPVAACLEHYTRERGIDAGVRVDCQDFAPGAWLGLRAAASRRGAGVTEPPVADIAYFCIVLSIPGLPYAVSYGVGVVRLVDEAALPTRMRVSQVSVDIQL